MPTLPSWNKPKARLALLPSLIHLSHTQQEALTAYEAGPLPPCQGTITLDAIVASASVGHQPFNSV